MIEPQHLPMLHTPSMNDTHFDEILLINQLSTAIANADVATIKEAFARLLEHTKEHYRSEEEMMLEKKFPPYLAHKEEHDESMEEMEKAMQDFLDTGDVDGARGYVDKKLIPWFLRHTETMDAVTSIFLENSEAHLPYWERLVPRNKS